MYQSKESFIRTFSFIMNMSIYEYIRKRRMTLAALELKNNTVKIIDLSLKYGYESPEAFTRAFKAIHGISPSAARKKGAKLNLYPRIFFFNTVKGDIEMDYQMDANDEQKVNLSGFNWSIITLPELKPVDNCICLASKWRESGRIDLLDLGTGLGRNAIYFAKQGFNVTAMDISGYAIDYLKKWAIKENVSIKADVGDMLCLPYPDHSFDCIFAYHVISHTDLLA